MPYKPKRPCSYPGCPNRTDEQYCDKHRKLRDEQYNRYGRDSFSRLFYTTPQWRKVRAQHLAEQPFCEECRKYGRLARARIVDHIIPIKQGGEPFDEHNLQSLCWSCHSSKSIKEGSRYG